MTTIGKLDICFDQWELTIMDLFTMGSQLYEFVLNLFILSQNLAWQNNTEMCTYTYIPAWLLLQ